jgi:hypothetical protein
MSWAQYLSPLGHKGRGNFYRAATLPYLLLIRTYPTSTVHVFIMLTKIRPLIYDPREPLGTNHFKPQYILIPNVLPCFGRHVKLLFPAALAVVSTHSSFKES